MSVLAAGQGAADNGAMTRRPVTGLDAGVLVLRSAGLFLFVTFGWTKLWDLFQIVRAGRSLSANGLAPLIHAVGFPAAAVLAVYVTLCESLGALCVALGLCTRVAATAAAVSMAGAFYYSMHVGEEPLRAALYLVTYASVAIMGPGTWSVDHLLASRRTVVWSAGHS
jgi:putative oxidoreductase